MQAAYAKSNNNSYNSNKTKKVYALTTKKLNTMTDLDNKKKKQFVCEYYDLAVNKKDFENAKKYMGPRYKQHNPLVKDGREGLHGWVCRIFES